MRALLFIALFVFGQFTYSASLTSNCNKSNTSKTTISSTSPPLSEHDFHFTENLRLLTWNVNLMTSWWLGIMFLYYADNQDMNDILIRAELIAEELADKEYDIIALQEVGDHTSKAILDKILGDAGYYTTDILGEKQEHVGDSIYVFNGGVTLYSKYPFSELEYHAFSRPAGLQYFMPKGVVYGKIDFHGRGINIFSLHLQSIQNNNKKEYDTLKMHQYDLQQLVKEKNIPPHEHVFLLGDFNVDAQNYLPEKERTPEFEDMLEVLDAREVASLDNCDEEISFNPDKNPMAKGKSPKGTLDNILCVNSSSACPYKGLRRIIHFEDKTTRLKELSDHYPMESEIQIP